MQFLHLDKGVNTGNDAAISCKNLVNFGAVTPEITFLIVYLCMVIGRKLAMMCICCVDISKCTGRLKCRWERLKWRWYMYISCKFGGLLFITSAVNAAQLCKASIDQYLD